MSGRAGRSQLLNVAVFIVLEVVALYLLASGSYVRQMWFGKWFTNIQAGIWEKVDNIHRYAGLAKENARLADENALLLDEGLKIKAQAAEDSSSFHNARLHYKVIPAAIVTMTYSSQHNYLIVDKGYADGVQKDDGIITSKGVIGVVTGVSRHFSYAISYANKNMTLSVRHGRHGIVGSLNWDGLHSNISILSGIPIHTEVEPGDTIYTSGFSQIFPPDIPVGTVKEQKGNNGSTADYSVALMEDFRTVSHVMIAQNLDRDEINEMINDQE